MLRLFPNRAGIDKNQVCILFFQGTPVAGMEQDEFHPVRVGDIHLATKSIQIDLFHNGKTVRESPDLCNPH